MILHAMKTRPEPRLSNFPRQLKRIQRAIREIANDPDFHPNARLRELEAIGEEIDEVWEELYGSLTYDQRIAYARSGKAP